MSRSKFPDVHQPMTRPDPRTIKRHESKRIAEIEPLGVYLGMSGDRKTPRQAGDTRDK